jgi:hypothetical protein
MTLEQKIDVLDKLMYGESITYLYIGSHFSVTESELLNEVKQPLGLLLKKACRRMQKLLIKAMICV